MAPLNVESFLTYGEHDGGQHSPDPYDDEASLFDDTPYDAEASTEDLSADHGTSFQEEPPLWEDERDA